MDTLSHQSALAIRPTRFTLFMRRCLLWQLLRFVIINLRMTVMILKSHDTRRREEPKRELALAPRR